MAKRGVSPSMFKQGAQKATFTASLLQLANRRTFQSWNRHKTSSTRETSRSLRRKILHHNSTQAAKPKNNSIQQQTATKTMRRRKTSPPSRKTSSIKPACPTSKFIQLIMKRLNSGRGRHPLPPKKVALQIAAQATMSHQATPKLWSNAGSQTKTSSNQYHLTNRSQSTAAP